MVMSKIKKKPAGKSADVKKVKRTLSKGKAYMRVVPGTVHETLKKHILADGFDLVVDLKKSHGAHIYDSRNKKWFLDFFSFFASAPIGMNHPKMMTRRFMDKIARVAVNKPTNSDIYTVEMAEFVDTFSRIAMPDYLPHAFFIEGGALGIENALKAAFDWKMRKNLAKGFYTRLEDESRMKVIHFKWAFHGRTGYTLSMTNSEPVKVDYYPKFNWPRILNPAVRYPLNDENLKAVTEAEQTALRQIKESIRTYGDDIACMIIEPIQGEGGDNHFRLEFFQALRTIADESDFMLIFDEVQSGIGLTGKMWAHQHFVKPDMIAFGKKTQVCGFLCGNRIDEVRDNVFKIPSRINSTWGGNLTDMVRSQRYLEIIEEENLVENARVVGEYLLGKLRELEVEFPGLVSNTRGRGLMCAMDMKTPELRAEFRKQCYQNGLIMLGCGKTSVRFRPPINITKNEVASGVEVIRKVLESVKA
jgi:L-lysine 6-transaminase